jgi:putative ABC transport system substrate-binding protein
LGSGTPEAGAKYIGVLRSALAELGLVEGRHFDFVPRFAAFKVERLPELAQELVQLKPALIVASAVDTAIVAKKATSNIPIVSAALADAEHLGLVASYARPGGNVTGITPYIAGLPAKQMELARELALNATKVALVGNMDDAKAMPQRAELEEAAREVGAKVVIADVRSPDDLRGSIRDLADKRPQIAIVLQTTMMLVERKNLAAAMATNQIPAIYGYRDHVDEGGLISYGVDLRWCWSRLASYVQKILNGAPPSDLPVEFPSRLQMVINLGTAKALDITIPPAVLARADEVIE